MLFLSSFSYDFLLLHTAMIVIIIISVQKIKFDSEKFSKIADEQVDYSLCTPMVKPFLMLYMTLIVMYGETTKYEDFLNYLLESCIITYILFGITFSQSYKFKYFNKLFSKNKTNLVEIIFF